MNKQIDNIPDQDEITEASRMTMKKGIQKAGTAWVDFIAYHSRCL